MDYANMSIDDLAHRVRVGQKQVEELPTSIRADVLVRVKAIKSQLEFDLKGLTKAEIVDYVKGRFGVKLDGSELKQTLIARAAYLIEQRG